MPKKVVKFIDLFSGMGGIRLGFEQAFKKAVRGWTAFLNALKLHK